MSTTVINIIIKIVVGTTLIAAGGKVLKSI